MVGYSGEVYGIAFVATLFYLILSGILCIYPLVDISSLLKNSPPKGLLTIDVGWLTGIIDGEGCFTTLKGDRPRPSFVLESRYDDSWIQRHIKRILGCGIIRIQKPRKDRHSSTARYEICRLGSIIENVIPVFDLCPFRTHKLYEYKLWRELAIILSRYYGASLSGIPKDVLCRMDLLKENLSFLKDGNAEKGELTKEETHALQELVDTPVPHEYLVELPGMVKGLV